MRPILRFCVIAMAFFALSGILLATPTIASQDALPADDDTEDGPIVAPQLKDALEPNALEMLRKEQRSHTNEAVLVVPLGDKNGILATFDNFTVLIRKEERDVASLWIFRGEELIQRGTTAFDHDEMTGAVDVKGTTENIRTGDRLVSEVSVAQDPSRPDGCSLIIDGRITVVRKDTKNGSASKASPSPTPPRAEVTTHTVFDVCREVVNESATNGSLPDDVIAQFEPGIGRTMARIAGEDLTIKPPGVADFGLDGRFFDFVPKLRCAFICAVCARFPPACRQCFQCLKDP